MGIKLFVASDLQMCHSSYVFFLMCMCGKLHMSPMEMNQNYLIGVDFDMKWDCLQIPKCYDCLCVACRY